MPCLMVLHDYLFANLFGDVGMLLFLPLRISISCTCKTFVKTTYLGALFYVATLASNVSLKKRKIKEVLSMNDMYHRDDHMGVA